MLFNTVHCDHEWSPIGCVCALFDGLWRIKFGGMHGCHPHDPSQGLGERKPPPQKMYAKVYLKAEILSEAIAKKGGTPSACREMARSLRGDHPISCSLLAGSASGGGTVSRRANRARYFLIV